MDKLRDKYDDLLARLRDAQYRLSTVISNLAYSNNKRPEQALDDLDSALWCIKQAVSLVPEIWTIHKPVETGETHSARYDALETIHPSYITDDGSDLKTEPRRNRKKASPL